MFGWERINFFKRIQDREYLPGDFILHDLIYLALKQNYLAHHLIYLVHKQNYL